MSDKDELARGIRPLDITPEQNAGKSAFALQHYVRDRMNPAQHAEYMRRYLVFRHGRFGSYDGSSTISG